MTMAAERGDVFSEEQMLADRDKEPRSLALDRCDSMIRWYEKNKSAHRIYWRGAQATAIVLSGITPIFVLLQTTMFENQKWRLFFTIMVALFPTLVAIITSLDGLFKWKDTYASFAQTSEMLKSEKVKYLTRSTRRYSKTFDDAKALDNFVATIERLGLEETASWRTQIEQAAELDELLQIAKKESGQGGSDAE